MAEPDSSAAARQSTESRNDQPVETKIDIEKLAEKVYRLMLADLRLAQARGARHSRRRTR